MAHIMRSDFAIAGSGLVGSGQHTNLEKLHDWLMDEGGLQDYEEVLSVTNYQQGRLGRLPNHILLVTRNRIAYTHDGGLRSIPLTDLNLRRIGLKAGIVNAELTLELDSGETLAFRKGVSLSVQEVAMHLHSFASALPSPIAAAPASQHFGRPATPASVNAAPVRGSVYFTLMRMVATKDVATIADAHDPARWVSMTAEDADLASLYFTTSCPPDVSRWKVGWALSEFPGNHDLQVQSESGAELADVCIGIIGEVLGEGRWRVEGGIDAGELWKEEGTTWTHVPD